MERKSYLQFRMKGERALYLRVTLCADCAPSLQLLPPLHLLLLPCLPFPLPPLSLHLGVRESFQTLPSPLKAGLEALCGGGRRERNVSGEGWWETVNHGHNAEGPGHPRGCWMRGNPPKAARYHEAAPCPWGHTERLCVPARAETWGEEGWDVPGLSQALVHLFLHREARKE